MKSPQIPGRPHGRIAVNVAVWLLGALLAGQVVAMGWALHKKKQAALSPPASEAAAVPAPADPPPNPAKTAPAQPAPEAAPLAAAPVPESAPPAVLSEQAPITDERVLFFLDNALARREKGDMKAALTHLRAACDLMPENPRLLYELANTYEAMTLQDKAAPVWDQIYRQGESAGIYFRIAQSKFEQGGAQPPREVEVPLQLGKIVEQRSARDPSLAENVTLRIPVQARDGAIIDPGKVSVVTQFYDVANGVVEESLFDNTQNYRWLSGEFPTWSTNSVEFLDQSYHRPKYADAAAGHDGLHYHGYVVKLYYDNHLQDMKAWPEQLASRQSEPGERGLLLPTNNNHFSPPRQPSSDQLDDSLFPLPQ